jgi:pre-mRNA-splicing factor CWC22
MKSERKSKKRKERDDTMDLDGSTKMDTSDLQPEQKKPKKEKRREKEREKLAVTEPSPVEAMPVLADETTKPKKRKRDEDGKRKERDEEKAAKKARKAERMFQKASNTSVIRCNVSLSCSLGISA